MIDYSNITINAAPWLFYDCPFSSVSYPRYDEAGDTLSPPDTPYYLHNADGSVDGYIHFPPGKFAGDYYINPAMMRYIDPADLVAKPIGLPVPAPIVAPVVRAPIPASTQSSAGISAVAGTGLTPPAPAAVGLEEVVKFIMAADASTKLVLKTMLSM